MSDKPRLDSDERTLFRLFTFIDSVYALGIVLIIFWLPLPEESKSEGGIWLFSLFAEFSENIIGVIIGVVFIVLYWLRSNQLLNHLVRTNGPHVFFSVAQVFFILGLLYIIRVGPEIEPASARAGESFMLIMTGLFGALGWRYASKNDLVCEDATKEQRDSAYMEAYTEPLTALVTLPFAFVGGLAWNLAFLAYFPIAAFLRKRR